MLKEISTLKSGSEFLSPLSSGVLVKTELKDADSVFMAVGANVIVKKKIKDAQESMEKQEKQITLMVSQLESQVSGLGNMINQLQSELQ